MNIPADANSGEVLALPAFCCPDCGHVIATTVDRQFPASAIDTLTGECPCGQQWFIQPPRVPAYYLTKKQRGIAKDKEAVA